MTDSSCGPDQGPVQCALSRNVTSGKTEKLKSKKLRQTLTDFDNFWWLGTKYAIKYTCSHLLLTFPVTLLPNIVEIS